MLSAIRTLESCEADIEALLPKAEKYGTENNWNSVISPIRKRIVGENISIISNNCIAGRLYSALGQKFCSPTINLIIRTEDFPKFCSNIAHYMKAECKFIGYNRRSSHPSEPYYPIGRCDDVDIHFVHYSDFETAVSAWNRRCERMIYDKLYFIFCENGEAIKRRQAEEFLELPYENKIIFKNMISWNIQDVIFCNETFNILSSDDLYERWFDLCGWVKHPERLNEYL